MKSFVVVVMFVSVSIVFAADDVIWQVAPPFVLIPRSGGQESGQAPKDRVADSDEKQTQAQDPKQHAGNVPVLKTEPQTKSAQTADQRREGSVDPNKVTKNAGLSPYLILWVVGGIMVIVVGWFTIGSFFVNLYQARRSKRADTLTEQHWERTERTTLVTNRAHVAIEQWELEGLRLDGAHRWINFSLVNRGGAPATIIGMITNPHLGTRMPLPFNSSDSSQKKLDTKLAGTKLHAGVPLPLGIHLPSGTAFRKEIESRRATLYAFVYVEYEDGFGQIQKSSVCVEYDLTPGGVFAPVGGSNYNYST